MEGDPGIIHFTPAFFPTFIPFSGESDSEHIMRALALILASLVAYAQAAVTGEFVR